MEKSDTQSVETLDLASDELALKSFLLDIDCLKQLSKWTSRFNIFDVLKAARTEIRHSNVLSWLLDPNENHGLGAQVLQGFIQYTADTLANDELFSDLLMDLGGFTIQREWRSIDILAMSEEQQYALVIENKIDSVEHSNQLNRYRDIVEQTFPDWRIRYVYLTPQGTESSDSQHWLAMSYEDVLETIQPIVEETTLAQGARNLINDYLEIIRRDIAEDAELARVCNEIYAKHKRAIDLIIENRPDRASELAEIFREWAEEKQSQGFLELVRDKCSKTYTRFRTPAMTELLPPNPDNLGAWNTPDHYFYEICQKDKLWLQMAVSLQPIEEELPGLRERLDKASKRSSKGCVKFFSYFVSQKLSIPEEIDPDKVKAQLDKLFAQATSFEENVISKVSR
ncbi:PD-(D/E)XK nuclease family protein [uncultured Adlercreutzia sp.]|uniref:PDDEXK-like family protein n=1 Tax=uncultured Adlercreutzia sp. TaxID=875803 RepID=UPI0025D11E37|nr:PD-(D/E)XK nuclease family protein [uncultured Adlercreutzia sp.]